MIWFWLALTVAFLVVETATVQFVTVWFAVGSAVTAIVKAIFPSMGIYWQILIFVLVSLVLLLSTRKIVKKLLKNRAKDSQTNLELNLDKEAVVVEEIDNVRGTGAVKINGLVWTARSCDDSIIQAGEIVVFKKVSGNKAMVKRKGI